MNQELIEKTQKAFATNFASEPQHIILSPGRINIIGEHVDYNDGFVLPAAIDKYVCVAISKSADSKCTLVAMDLDKRYEFEITDELQPVDQMWVNYFLGVLKQFQDRNYKMSGFNLVFTSTVPIGAGMSSSAAIECGFGFAMNVLFDLGIEKKDLALIGQKAEHTFVGVKCGIMDQFASIFGKKDHVIKLDCNTLEYEYHNADFKDYSLLLLDSNVKHTLLTSQYNTRREEVEKGLAIIKESFPEVCTFRDCTEEQVISVKDKLGETIYKRCHFVVKEINRVLLAVDALENHDFKELGRLMFETHDGLSKEYEVSCDETDFLADAVRNDERVLGARMMGGGFGGCTINLVRKGSEDDLVKEITVAYRAKFDIEMKSYKVALSDGTTQYK